MLTIELRSIGDIRPYPTTRERTTMQSTQLQRRFVNTVGDNPSLLIPMESSSAVTRVTKRAEAWYGSSASACCDRSFAGEFRAYRIADNQSADLADWNYDLLPIELKELGEGGYDLGLLGFDADELAKLLDTGVNEGLTDPDDVPEPPDEAVTQLGDLWILGNHRLLCGDSSRRQTWIDSWRRCDPFVQHRSSYNVKVSLDRITRSLRVCLRSPNDAASGRLKQGQGNAASFGVDHERVNRSMQRLTRSFVQRIDRLRMTSSATRRSTNCSMIGWKHCPSLTARSLLLHLGWLRQLRQLSTGAEEAWLYFSQSIIWDKQHPVLTRKDFMGGMSGRSMAGRKVPA